MPQACNVSMSYQVIHERVPDRDFNFYGGPMGGVGAGMQIQRESEYTQYNMADFDEGEFKKMIMDDIFHQAFFTMDRARTGADIGEREYLEYVEIAKMNSEFPSDND